MGMIRKKDSSSDAFTIVELLIVIIVIGILAAITIVAYNGISGRAGVAGVQSDLASASKLLENARTTSTISAYPADQTAAQAAGMNSSIIYTAAMGGYCATKSVNGAAYIITATNPKVHAGPGCTLTNTVTNPTFESATVLTSGWTAASQETISRTTAYSSNGLASLQAVRSATAGNGYVSTTLTTTVGKKYSISFDVRQVSGIPALSATIKNALATGTIPADASTIAFTPTASFTRYTVTWTAESPSSYFVIDTTTSVVSTYSIDSVMATEGDNSFAYTDPTIAGSTWTWVTANNSPSTGPAF